MNDYFYSLTGCLWQGYCEIFPEIMTLPLAKKDVVDILLDIAQEDNQ